MASLRWNLLACAALAALGGCERAPPAPPAVPPVVQAPAPPPAPPLPEEAFEIVGAQVAPRQTLATCLSGLGVGNEELQGVLRALRGCGFDFRRTRAGDQIRLTRREGRLEQVEVRASALDEWRVRRAAQGWEGARREVRLEKQIAVVTLTIESSVYEAMLAAGEDPGLAVDVADVLAWDVDFYRDVRKGDRIRVVVEKLSAQGRLLRYGDVLGVRYEGALAGGKRLLRYGPRDGAPSYFDAQGNSARRAFLKSPLKYVQITSRYGGRTHPVSGYYHQHQGVDFAAAIGTPVWAVADGVVARLVRGDPAGGHYLFLRHANGLETGYLHLSRFAEGIHPGARVRQKQVIAFSGNTGRSTGPHLHFAMKRGGSYINPLSLKLPRAEPLPAAEMARFAEQTGAVAGLLDGELVAAL